MTSWLKRTQAGIQSAPTTPAITSAPGFIPTNSGRILDPNAPDVRLDVESRCVYERRLPGSAYITAHITRLQDGFYDSPSTHGDCINNVRFLAVSFVFHPSETINRFQAATVTIGLHDDTDQAFTDPTPGHKVLKEPRNKPKFLRYAPHVLFGGVSPETLDWNFNLTGSLGVSQTPASASISPSGGVSGSYKVYQMMRVQGSTRTILARHHHEYDIEDGEVCWTMEENALQKSGLPREMTFVMMITKGDVENVVCDIDIKPKVASWFGHYPGWWNNTLRYRPLPKEHIDLDMELGQTFQPVVPGRGFNFANLAGTFNDFVSLPGTTYSLTDHAFANQVSAPDAKGGQEGQNKNTKSSSKPNAQQPQSGQPAKSTNPPSRPQTVPPPSDVESSEAPMDYHIYLHNPRTINLHATPPPQQSTSPPPAPSASAQTQSQKYSYQPPINIIRPKSTAPTSSSNHQRVSSPANTKMKRRSIDIANVKNSPYYDEAKTPKRNLSGQSSSGGSLRRRGSKTDLRHSPVAEENSQSSSTGSTSGDTSDSASRSSRLSLARSRSLSNPSSPKSVIIEAPSPPDPGLSGFKARLQAHMASERERERDRDRSHERDRLRPQPRSRNTDRLPFEVQPQPHRPPREITPSPDPTDNPNSESTQDDLLEDRSASTVRATTDTKTSTNANTNPHLLDVTTNTPTRRERLILTSPPPPSTSPVANRPQTRSPETMMIPPRHTTTTNTSAATTINGTRSPPPQPTAQSPTLPKSPPSASLHNNPRPISPYAYAYAATATTDPKWDGFRTAIKTRRESTGSQALSISPDQSDTGSEHSQPVAGDLKEEARRRQRKRLSMSMAGSSSMSGVGSGSASRGSDLFGSMSGDRVVGMLSPGERLVAGGGKDGVIDRGYEYITEADGEWEDR